QKPGHHFPNDEQVGRNACRFPEGFRSVQTAHASDRVHLRRLDEPVVSCSLLVVCCGRLTLGEAQGQDAVVTSLATAAHASTTPRAIRGPALPASGSKRAVPRRSAPTSGPVSRGFRSSNNAAIPETWAAASELPDRKSYVPPGAVVSTSTPGAARRPGRTGP